MSARVTFKAKGITGYTDLKMASIVSQYCTSYDMPSASIFKTNFEQDMATMKRTNHSDPSLVYKCKIRDDQKSLEIWKHTQTDRLLFIIQFN